MTQKYTKRNVEALTPELIGELVSIHAKTEEGQVRTTAGVLDSYEEHGDGYWQARLGGTYVYYPDGTAIIHYQPAPYVVSLSAETIEGVRAAVDHNLRRGAN